MLTKTYTKQVNIETLKRSIQSSSITIAIESISTLGTQVTIAFKANLDPAAESVLDSVVSSHVYTPFPTEAIQVIYADEKKTTEGIPKFAVYEPEGDASTIVSHNFADKTSWAVGAVQVTNEILDNTIANKFVSPNARLHWIDLKHGRLYDEDNALIANPTWHPVIKVDNVVKTESLGVVVGDYTIDYVTGEVTFLSAPNGVVTATYRYADKSWFVVKPKVGKKLSINTAEVQFARDTVLGGIGGEFVFEAWFNHPTYGMIPVPGTSIKYKNAKDFISACNKGTGQIEPWGEITQPVFVFPFDYARPKPIRHSQGVEIRVYIKNHQPVGGQYATATFYVTVENEVAPTA